MIGIINTIIMGRKQKRKEKRNVPRNPIKTFEAGYLEGSAPEQKRVLDAKGRSYIASSTHPHSLVEWIFKNFHEIGKTIPLKEEMKEDVI